MQSYRQYAQSPSVYIRLCKQDKNFTIASIKYFSKHTNKTMFICFHLSTYQSAWIDYLKYFIIIDLIAVTWGWGLGRILAEGPSRVCKTMDNFPSLLVFRGSYVNTRISHCTVASIKYFSKQRNTTMFVKDVKTPIDQ